MPACAAHYQFGRDILNSLDGKLRTAVLAYPREYDIGQQGPDIFFFYQPYRRNRITAYGVRRHDEPAARMFAPILKMRREKAALSYLAGLICHYALDKWCHPYVYAHSGGSAGHARMEAAFDLHIMALSGLQKPRFHYLPADGLDFAAMAALWPGIGAQTFRKSVLGERRAVRLLDHKKLLELLEKASGRPGALTPITLPAAVPEALSGHVRNLYALYEKALKECPALLRTALDAMGGTLPARSGFELNYRGTAGDS